VKPDVAALIQLFNDSDLVELAVERGGRRLHLRKGEAPDLTEEPLVEPDAPQPRALTAHMVGIFYWSKDKPVKPAVTVGQHVNRGQIIGFIEAMGIMNELEAGHAGKVVEIAVAGGQPVDYGQTIVVLTDDESS
jgi:biotin carboxyl carrier protein